MSSVRILNEGININKCDSVFITKVSNNEITAVQRLCRANRLDKENKNKIANCFIWSDDINKIVNMLQYLKDNDNTCFFNKIKSISGNYDLKSNSNEIKKIDEKEKEIIENVKIKCMSFEEIWKHKLDKVKEYIDENGKRPSGSDKNNNIKTIGRWIETQNTNYPNKNLMKNYYIREKWEEFLKEYSEYFLSNEDKWINNLIQVKEYIIEFNKRPSSTDRNKEVKKIGEWILTQKINYPDKCIMKNDNVKKLWEEFVKEYSEYFLSNEEIWINNLTQVKEYIIEYNKRPSSFDKNNNIKFLGNWLITQKSNYPDKYSMKNEDIKKQWEEFIKEYEEYFISKEEIWIHKLDKLKEYVINHNKLPSKHDKNKEIKVLGYWIYTQKAKYPDKQIMKNEDIRKQWEEFIKEYLK